MQTEGNVALIKNLFGSIALVTSFVGLLPQIYKSYKIKSTQDISMAMLINYCVCSVAWVVYGLSTQSSYVVLSNVFGLAVCLTSIFQKVHYDTHTRTL